MAGFGIRIVKQAVIANDNRRNGDVKMHRVVLLQNGAALRRLSSA